MDLSRFKVSIIVPNFNNRPYLKECVDSCLRQTHRNLEVVFVDDASTDDSWKEAGGLYGADPRVVLHRLEKNRGSQYARRYGRKAATGDYFCFLDSDDYLADESVVEVFLSELARSGCDIAYGAKKIFNQDIGGECQLASQAPRDEDPRKSIALVFPSTCTLMFDRRFFDRFDWKAGDLICQEYDLVVPAVLRGATIAYNPKAFSMIREHGAAHRKGVRYKSSYQRKIVRLWSRYLNHFPEVGADPALRSFFSFHLSRKIIWMHRFAPEKDARFAARFWKYLRKGDIVRSDRFSWFSWSGLAVLTGPSFSASAWGLRDRLAEFCRRVPAGLKKTSNNEDF